MQAEKKVLKNTAINQKKEEKKITESNPSKPLVLPSSSKFSDKERYELLRICGR